MSVIRGVLCAHQSNSKRFIFAWILFIRGIFLVLFLYTRAAETQFGQMANDPIHQFRAMTTRNWGPEWPPKWHCSLCWQVNRSLDSFLSCLLVEYPTSFDHFARKIRRFSKDFKELQFLSSTKISQKNLNFSLNIRLQLGLFYLEKKHDRIGDISLVPPAPKPLVVAFWIFF